MLPFCFLPYFLQELTRFIKDLLYLREETNIYSTKMIITSSSFEDGQNIPSKFTCDGGDINPELLTQYVPDNAKSLVLIVDDPDVSPAEASAKAGTRPFTHWTVWNIDPKKTIFKEDSVPPGLPKSDFMPGNAVEGTTDFGRIGYGGPCPPASPAGKSRRYYFHLYALDQVLDLPSGAAREALDKAMDGHILAEAKIMGLYAR